MGSITNYPLPVNIDAFYNDDDDDDNNNNSNNNIGTLKYQEIQARFFGVLGTEKRQYDNTSYTEYARGRYNVCLPFMKGGLFLFRGLLKNNSA